MERIPSPHERAHRHEPDFEEVIAALKQIAGGRTAELGEPVLSQRDEIRFLTMMVKNIDGTAEEFNYALTDDGGIITVTDIAPDGTVGQPMILAEYHEGSWVTKEGALLNPGG
jgi:hypothetical protein